MLIATHVIAELYDVEHLTDLPRIDTVLRDAAFQAGATVLGGHFHEFGNGGITGVLLLAESHMSIHTWPEHRYAALDIFMCGAADPVSAVRLVATGLGAARCETKRIDRGLSRTSSPSLVDNTAPEHGC